MSCPKCGDHGKVYLNRKTNNGNVYRRRVCRKCGERWTTIEIPKDTLKEIVISLAKTATDLKDGIKGAGL